MPADIGFGVMDDGENPAKIQAQLSFSRQAVSPGRYRE